MQCTVAIDELLTQVVSGECQIVQIAHVPIVAVGYEEAMVLRSICAMRADVRGEVYVCRYPVGNIERRILAQLHERIATVAADE